MKRKIINFLLISIILLMSSHTEVYAQEANSTVSDEISLAPKDILKQINKIETSITETEADIKVLEEEIKAKQDKTYTLEVELKIQRDSIPPHIRRFYDDNYEILTKKPGPKINSFNNEENKAFLNSYFVDRAAIGNYTSILSQLDNLEIEIENKIRLVNLKNSYIKEKENEIHELTAQLGLAIVAYADQFVGNPYVWGGNSLTTGIDCSHFVYQVLKNCEVYSDGYVTSAGWRSKGAAVSSLAEAKAGDIICYSGHVAIYDGNGGIVEAKGSKWGITHDRQADCSKILAIRRFI